VLLGGCLNLETDNWRFSKIFRIMVLKTLNTAPGKSCWMLNNLFILKKRVNLKIKKNFSLKTRPFGIKCF
jgi:hypothetical protein